MCVRFTGLDLPGGGTDCTDFNFTEFMGGASPIYAQDGKKGRTIRPSERGEKKKKTKTSGANKKEKPFVGQPARKRNQ